MYIIVWYVQVKQIEYYSILLPLYTLEIIKFSSL